MTTPFRLKPYPFYDISGNDPGTAFAKANPRPYAYIVRGAVARYPGNGVYWSTADVVPDELAGKVFAETRGTTTRFSAYAYMLQGKMDQQVEVFLAAMKAAGILVGGRWLGEIPPVADVEVEAEVKRPRKLPRHWVDPITGRAWAAQVHYWLTSVEQAAGVRPWIYTARPQWKWLLTTIRVKDEDGNSKLDYIPPAWTKDYRFWVKWYADSFARIDANVVLPVGALPTGVSMEQVMGWQYHDKGKTHGFDYNDLNTMTEAGVKVLGSGTGSGEVPVPEPEPIPVPARVLKRVVLEYSDGTQETRP